MKRFFLYLMAVLYVAAGINHFLNTSLYAAIVPPYLPWPVALTYISGVAEIILGMLFAIRVTRRLAAAGIIFLLIAVFPANIQMAINYSSNHNPCLWLAIARLPLQVLLIWWAWYYYRHPGAASKK